jgi:hypothetical protein
MTRVKRPTAAGGYSSSDSSVPACHQGSGVASSSASTSAIALSTSSGGGGFVSELTQKGYRLVPRSSDLRIENRALTPFG